MVTVIQILNQYVFGLQPEYATNACDGSTPPQTVIGRKYIATQLKFATIPNRQNSFTVRGTTCFTVHIAVPLQRIPMRSKCVTH